MRSTRLRRALDERHLLGCSHPSTKSSIGLLETAYVPKRRRVRTGRCYHCQVQLSIGGNRGVSSAADLPPADFPAPRKGSSIVPSLFLHLLGDPVLLADGAPVTGRAAYRRRLALLAILAVARGRPVGRERIIGLLWPEKAADGARHTLSEALYVLRKDLGDDLFLSVGDEIALNPAVLRSDLAEFEEAVDAGRLQDAVRACGGPLLDGFYVSDAPDFERWVDAERDRVSRLLAQALEGLALAAEAARDPAAAAEWWRRLAAHDRFSSRVALRLVRALEAAGDRMSALRFAGAHAVLLREELGREPDREMAALVERLRTEPPPPVEAPPVPPPNAHFSASAQAATDVITPARERSSDAAASARASSDDAVSVDATEAMTAGGSRVHPANPPRSADNAHFVPPAAFADPANPADRTNPADLRNPADPANSADPANPANPARPAGIAHHADIARPVDPKHLADPATDAAPRDVPRSSIRGRSLRAALAGAAIVALAVTAAALVRETGRAKAAPAYDPRRIAVLYLDDYSPGGELDYLANGLTEMLIHQLAQVEGLDVVSRNGVRPYRERAVPLDSISADLRAGTVVEGSVQRSGDSVRVTVQLIDANTQVHLESRSIVLPMDPDHLFALQDTVAAEVAAGLRRRVGQEVRLIRMRQEAGNPRALELVLRAGRARADARDLARSAHPRDVAAALRMLAEADSLAARAGRLDPRWDEPALLRGWLAVDRGRLTSGPAQLAVFRDARDRAEWLLARNPGDADARELRGSALWLMVLAAPAAARGEPWLADAEHDLRAVVAADPERASAWATLGQLLRLGGDLAEGDLAARRAREADAYLQVAEVGAERLYRAALALGDLPRARHWCADGRRRFPADYRFRECALVLLARDPAARAPADSAWRLLAEADRVDPPATARAAARPYSPVFRRMMVAAVLARAGRADSARAVSARARAAVRNDPEMLTSYLWDEAYLQLQLGHRERAAALLDTFVARRPGLREYAARDPAFQGLLRP